MKTFRCKFIIYLLASVFVFCLNEGFSQDIQKKINLSAQKAEAAKKKLTKGETKIMSVVLKTVNRMIKENAYLIKGSLEMVQTYSSKMVRVDREGRLLVNVNLRPNTTPSQMNSVVDLIVSLGGKIRQAHFPESYINWYPEIFSWIPYDKMKQVARDTVVNYITMVEGPRTRTRQYLPPRNSRLKSDQARQIYGPDSTRIKTRVISPKRTP